MSRFPLSSKGVEDKLIELYSLSDSVLTIEAAAVKANFKEWIEDNFTLKPVQVAYLLGMNITAADYFGSQCSICFLNRLPIILNYPMPPETKYTKLVVMENNIIVECTGFQTIVVSGFITFNIRHKQ